jgi:DNA-binding transcriptional LysR family regulator
MELRHLRTFVVLADQRTVSMASLRLRKPALSRQVAHLEAELGYGCSIAFAGKRA